MRDREISAPSTCHLDEVAPREDEPRDAQARGRGGRGTTGFRGGLRAAPVCEAFSTKFVRHSVPSL